LDALGLGSAESAYLTCATALSPCEHKTSAGASGAATHSLSVRKIVIELRIHSIKRTQA